MAGIIRPLQVLGSATIQKVSQGFKGLILDAKVLIAQFKVLSAKITLGATGDVEKLEKNLQKAQTRADMFARNKLTFDEIFDGTLIDGKTLNEDIAQLRKEAKSAGDSLFGLEKNMSKLPPKAKELNNELGDTLELESDINAEAERYLASKECVEKLDRQKERLEALKKVAKKS